MKSLVTLTTVILVVVILMLTIRGNFGVPDVETLHSNEWMSNGPLELSPERGRLALIYSIIEDHSLQFSVPVAHLAIPDLAVTAAGEYVSLFAPAVSFIAIPGYILGKILGASIVGAYAIIAFFAFLNFLLLRSIALRFGAEPWAALLGALTFTLATPALPYAGTLYQHHLTVTLLLLSIWIIIRYRNIWSLGIVWFACALSVVVDNPNLFLMFPVGVYGLVRLWNILSEVANPSKRAIHGVLGVLTFITVLFPLGFFGWYNFAAYGNPLQLPGTLKSVSEIGADGKPVAENSYEQGILSPEQLAAAKENSVNEKSAVGFFKTRNLYNGFYVHFISPDRSVLWFAPVILIGIIGLIILYGRRRDIASLLVACIGANILLYSMWGDPWGGWAFGSRYLIPTYALLAIGVAFALSRWRFSLATLAVFIPLFVFSLWVNTLGAVTTLTNPPEVQVLSLEKQSGHEEKYTFMRNWEFLNGRYQPAIGSKAFVYQVWAKEKVSARGYLNLVFGLGLAAILIVLTSEFFPLDRVSNWLKSRRV